MGKQHISWDDVRVGDLVAQAFDQGLLVASDTDTVLGLLAPLSLHGYERLNRAKSRIDKPYLALAASIKQVEALVVLPETQAVQRLIATCWPGPLTLICPVQKAMRMVLPASYATLGVRIPAHEGLHRLLVRFGPLFSTSANITGEPVPAMLNQLDERLLAHIGLMVGPVSPQPAMVPSTILEVTQERMVLVREGAYPWPVLQDIMCGVKK